MVCKPSWLYYYCIALNNELLLAVKVIRTRRLVLLVTRFIMPSSLRLSGVTVCQIRGMRRVGWSRRDVAVGNNDMISWWHGSHLHQSPLTAMKSSLLHVTLNTFIPSAVKNGNIASTHKIPGRLAEMRTPRVPSVRHSDGIRSSKKAFPAVTLIRMALLCRCNVPCPSLSAALVLLTKKCWGRYWLKCLHTN